MKRTLTTDTANEVLKRPKTDGQSIEILTFTNLNKAGDTSDQTTSIALKESTETKDYPTTHQVHYLTNEYAVNVCLQDITGGVVGLDTEFMPRVLSAEELFIEDIFANVPGNKRSALIAWQVTQIKENGELSIKWENVGLCVVQIARGNDVWLLNMNRIRAFPRELKRVLEADAIVKVGVGIAADLPVLWNDLATNLSLQQSVSDVLGYTIAKDLQKSNWKGDQQGDITDEQKKYAAIDAHAALRMYEILAPGLKDTALKLGEVIPEAWYTFNGKYGYTVRRKKSRLGKDVQWSTADCTWFFAGKFQGFYP
ncbi:ribonuclease H-like domain-containing protein [Mycena vitilis]|nr:ribonuclease H-like domain-containing protein [Mycena vitilis]